MLGAPRQRRPGAGPRPLLHPDLAARAGDGGAVVRAWDRLGSPGRPSPTSTELLAQGARHCQVKFWPPKSSPRWARIGLSPGIGPPIRAASRGIFPTFPPRLAGDELDLTMPWPRSQTSGSSRPASHPCSPAHGWPRRLVIDVGCAMRWPRSQQRCLRQRSARPSRWDWRPSRRGLSSS